MAVESLLLTAKVGHSSEDFVRRAHFLEFLNFCVTKFSLGTLRSHAGHVVYLSTTFSDRTDKREYYYQYFIFRKIYIMPNSK